MIVCGQTFLPDALERIQFLVSDIPDISRRSLSRHVCEWLDWRHSNGRLKDMSCRKALSHLHNTGVVRLPDTFQIPAFTVRPVQDQFVRSPVACSLQELGLLP